MTYNLALLYSQLPLSLCDIPGFELSQVVFPSHSLYLDETLLPDLLHLFFVLNQLWINWSQVSSLAESILQHY